MFRVRRLSLSVYFHRQRPAVRNTESSNAIDRHERVVQTGQLEGSRGSYQIDRARIERAAKTGLIQYGREATMATYRNYGQERAERNRLKRVKQDAKLRELEEAVARRKATLDPTSSLPEPEPVNTADAPDR
jgi:hypothetical protein